MGILARLRLSSFFFFFAFINYSTKLHIVIIHLVGSPGSYSHQNTNHGSTKLPDISPKQTKKLRLGIGFDKRSPTKSVKVFAIMPKGIMGSNVSVLLG